MASAAPATSLSTKETTNYARLCGLLVDVGTQALRVTFDRIHAPGSLHTVLANPPAHSILQSLKKILNPNQWSKLYPAIPSSVSSVNFDITLLMVLLRNICGLSPPASGWDALPPPGDTSTEADIVRVSCFRDTMCSHEKQASVDDASFRNYWKDIKTTLVRLGGMSYGVAIDQFKSACMTPEVVEHHKELLKQWKKDVDRLMEDATSSNRETTHYARLCRLLVDVGNQALRDRFDQIHTPLHLYKVLSSPTVQTILQDLYMPPTGRRKILNSLQWSKLYPAIPSTVCSAHFDITLLMILFRNICGLSPPATGWDALPPSGDTSIEGDIARVKHFRNNVYGHAEEASVDEASFNNYWQDIKEPLVRLGGPSYEAAIDQLKNAGMDPEVEEHYKELLKQWKKDEDSIKDRLEHIESDIKYVRKKLDDLTEIVSPKTETIVEEIATCDTDIAFFTERHDLDTRQWLLDDFFRWFNDPGDSRAYVLLGDAGVGKSVMAGVLAQRMRRAGNLGAAYFCRLNDDTRNNPRYLLGTIACQLCKCNSQYNSVVGGEGGIRKLLGNSELGIQELFTKLLLEPLAKCNSCHQRKLVVIDALDETKYESRDDFLDLIMNRFPLLPHWLVFFITSRPEDTVQFRLKNYNPCIKICAGSGENLNFYQQHEQDIKRFLENSIDFSNVPYSVEDIAKKCNGLFLYAFYIARFFKDPAHSGKIAQLTDLFPGDFEDFCLKNFKRVFDKVGADLYKKVFGCAIVAPSPLPVSFISFILQRENSDLEKQEVIDALSIFLVLRTSDQTFTFLHNLIPGWLTDKNKASRKLFVDRTKAGKYFRDIIAESLSAFVDEQTIERLSIDPDILEYIVRVGVRFLCGFSNKDSLETICGCLTNLKFIQRRIQNRKREIYALIEDFKLAAECHVGVDGKKKLLQEICAALEGNVYVLSECPYLLHSCLRSTCKGVQGAVNPDGVITTWMECTYFPYPGYKFPHDIKCFALSPDKKILAGGRQRCLVLFDACTLEKVEGHLVLKVRDGHIRHLEFSPDGKFVFFGRLDEWFSVDQECIMEFPQFAKNRKFYEWGSLFHDGRYIVVKDGPLKRGYHNDVCVVNMFCRWAAQELDQMQDSDIVSWCDPDKLDRGLLVSRGFDLKSVKDLCEVLKRKQDVRWCSRLEENIRYYQSRAEHSYKLCCPQCCEFEQRYQNTTLALVRQRVIDLYHAIFQYQIWNMESGRPALEEAFSPGVSLSPFSFLCHLITPLEWREKMFSYIDKAPSFYSVALINALYHLSDEKDVIDFDCLIPDSFKLDPFFVANAPVEFQNRLTGTYRSDVRVSPDRKWIAVTWRHGYRKVSLFQKRNHVENFNYGKPIYVIKGVEHFAFVEDSSVFLYYTDDKLLHALRLETGIKLFSASGLSPFFHPLKQVGYLLGFAQGKELIEFLILFQSSRSSLETTFISAGTILSVVFRGIWKGVDDVVSFAHVKNFVFSQDSNLVAIHQATSIGVIDCGKFLYSLCGDHREYDESYLAFSTDSKLLLYCIQNSIDNPRFYVWDVQNRVFSASFDSPSRLLSIDCCCLSSDNVKLVICGGFSIEIWEYGAPACRLITRVETNVSVYSEVDKFSYCTVSPKHNLLACCITDRIVLYTLNTPTDQFIGPLPRAHLGKIEFCQFLKGNRYLISYGVDGTVFLWDLHEWRPIAFAKIAQGRENIVSLCVTHVKDEVVCLTSDGRYCVLNLCGLEHTIPSTLPAPKVKSTGKMIQEARGQIGEQHGLTVQSTQYSHRKDTSEDLDVDTLIEEMNLTCMEDSEDSDYGDDRDVRD